MQGVAWAKSELKTWSSLSGCESFLGCIFTYIPIQEIGVSSLTPWLYISVKCTLQPTLSLRSSTAQVVWQLRRLIHIIYQLLYGSSNVAGPENNPLEDTFKYIFMCTNIYIYIHILCNSTLEKNGLKPPTVSASYLQTQCFLCHSSGPIYPLVAIMGWSNPSALRPPGHNGEDTTVPSCLLANPTSAHFHCGRSTVSEAPGTPGTPGIGMD